MVEPEVITAAAGSSGATLVLGWYMLKRAMSRLDREERRTSENDKKIALLEQSVSNQKQWTVDHERTDGISHSAMLKSIEKVDSRLERLSEDVNQIKVQLSALTAKFSPDG